MVFAVFQGKLSVRLSHGLLLISGCVTAVALGLPVGPGTGIHGPFRGSLAPSSLFKAHRPGTRLWLADRSKVMLGLLGSLALARGAQASSLKCCQP